MSDLKSFVGRRSETLSFEVTEARLKQFCDSIGAPYRGEAPPTFMTLFRDGEFKLLAEIGITLAQVLHADQEFRYQGKILPGDSLEYDTELAKALEKNGSSGSMRFMTYETTVRAKRDGAVVPVGVSKTTIIARQ